MSGVEWQQGSTSSGAAARVVLRLERVLDVVGTRARLVVVEGVIQDGEAPLWRDRVGRVREHGAQHVGPRRDFCRCLAAAELQVERVLLRLAVAPLLERLGRPIYF